MAFKKFSNKTKEFIKKGLALTGLSLGAISISTTSVEAETLSDNSIPADNNVSSVSETTQTEPDLNEVFDTDTIDVTITEDLPDISDIPEEKPVISSTEEPIPESVMEVAEPPVDVLDGSFMEPEAQGDVENFVERAYSEILNRESDADGKNYWVIGINHGKQSGASIIANFIHSQEYREMNKSDADYVEDLYKSCLGRNSDPDGKAFWIQQLASGKTRDEVMAGFINSKEYTQICDVYGISRGTAEKNGTITYNSGVRTFVENNYKGVLSRHSETEGAEFWSKQIIDKGMTVDAFKECSICFFHSKEFLEKNYNNEQFVDTLYHTFLRREPDADGKAFWLAKMEIGMTRDEVIDGFVNSQEFGQFIDDCKNDRIYQSNLTAKDIAESALADTQNMIEISKNYNPNVTVTHGEDGDILEFDF